MFKRTMMIQRVGLKSAPSRSNYPDAGRITGGELESWASDSEFLVYVEEQLKTIEDHISTLNRVNTAAWATDRFCA